MKPTRVCSLLAVAAGVFLLPGTARAISIVVPNGSFETDAVGSNWSAGGPTPTNWNTQFTNDPNAFQGPNYGIEGPSNWPSQPAANGSQLFSFWPGEFYTPPTGPGSVVQMNVTMTLSSTGIAATTIAGDTYTATVAVGLPTAALGINNFASPAFTVSILDNGNVVASNSIPAGATPGGAWYDLSSLPYVAPNNGDSLQVQVYADHFYEGPGIYQQTQAMVDNARLSFTAVPEPGSCALLAIGLVGLVVTLRRFRQA